MPAESRENPMLKKGNSDAFFKEKHLTKNRRADLSLQFIQESSTESVAQISIVEMMSLAPESIVAVTALRNKTMI